MIGHFTANRPLPRDGWTMLGFALALVLRQSPAEAALTMIGLRILLERIADRLGRRQ